MFLKPRLSPWDSHSLHIIQYGYALSHWFSMYSSPLEVFWGGKFLFRFQLPVQSDTELQWKPEHLMSFVFFSIFQGVGPWDAGSQFECSLSKTISVGDLISTFGLYEINKRISWGWFNSNYAMKHTVFSLR